MCGICGEFVFGKGAHIDPCRLKQMVKLLAHRGPDDEGQYVSGSLGLGFRRLSIIDVEGGHQPMSDLQKSVWVVFNGEIYNFPELRNELETRGHVFRTNADTEVIINGYKQWGDDVLNKLNGMFGLAIWDNKQQRLLLARDRMGIKPVYYSITSGRLVFASEIRPLLRSDGANEVRIDPAAIYLFLRYRYTPSPLTIYEGIEKLAPGTKLVVAKGGTPRTERWWNFQPSPFEPMPSAREAEEELYQLYRNAVRRQLVSDVPVGLLLSGGMDSALLLSLMNDTGRDWRTYTVGYGSSFSDDELPDGARSAEALNSRHASLKIDREVFDNSLPKIISCLEEPLASSSIVPMFHVCERAARDVKVVLSGQGPDELFGGYKRHLGVRYGGYWRAMPKFVRSLLTDCVRRLPRFETLKRGTLSLGTQNRMKRYQEVFSVMPGLAVNKLFRAGILEGNVGDRIQECWAGLDNLLRHTDELGGFQFLETRSSLPDELLMYSDRLSMAHGLEVRVPYLDHEIVEYAERLNASFKIRMGRRKWIHKRICSRYLPGEIVRRKKRGFAVNVVDDWFKRSFSRGTTDLLVDDSSLIYQFLRPAAVRRLLTKHRAGWSDNHKILFSLVVLETLLRSHRS